MMIKFLKNHILVLLLYTLIACIFFYRLFLPSPSIFFTPEYGKSDITHFNFAVKTILGESLKKNQLPLWNKNMAAGYPIYAESQMGALYLPNLILFKFLPSWLAFNISYVSTFIIGSFGMYFYLLYLKRSQTTSFYGGLIFVFSGFFMGHITHLNVIQEISLFPWIVIFVEKFLLKPSVRLFAISSFILCQQLFSGHLQMTFLTGLFLALMNFPFFVDKQYKKVFRRLVFLLLICVTAILLASIQIFPSLELQSVSTRAKAFDYQYVVHFSLHPKHLSTLLSPFIMGKASDGSYTFHSTSAGNIFWENNLYFGFLMFILFIFSLKYLKNKHVRVLWFMELVWMFAMFGKYSPFYFIYTIPPFSFFTTPARFSILFLVIALLLTTYTLDKVFYNKRKFIHIIGIITLVELFAYWWSYHPVVSVDKFLSPPRSVQYVNENKNNRIVGINSGAYHFEYYIKNGWKNTENYQYYRNEIIPNTNIFWNIPHYDVYVGRIWLRRKHLFDRMLNADSYGNEFQISDTNVRLLSIANVSKIISSGEVFHKALLEKASIDPPSYINKDNKYYIYDNKSVLPRARIVFKSTIATTVEDFFQIIKSQKFNPQDTVILEKNVQFPSSSKDNQNENYSITWEKDENTEIKLITKSYKDGFLVLADSFYPGWNAYIDGKNTKIYPAYIAFRTIQIPKGNHVVTFRYEPESFNRGAIITLISFTLLILAVSFSFFLQRYRASSSRL